MASLAMMFDFMDSTSHSIPPIYRPLLYLVRSSSPQKTNTTHSFSNEGVGFKSYTLNVYIGVHENQYQGSGYEGEGKKQGSQIKVGMEITGGKTIHVDSGVMQEMRRQRAISQGMMQEEVTKCPMLL